jgi:hypothetical protein
MPLEEAPQGGMLTVTPRSPSAVQISSSVKSGLFATKSRMTSAWASMRADRRSPRAVSAAHLLGHARGPANGSHSRRSRRSARQLGGRTSRWQWPIAPGFSNPATRLSTCLPASAPADSSNHFTNDLGIPDDSIRSKTALALRGERKRCCLLGNSFHYPPVVTGTLFHEAAAGRATSCFVIFAGACSPAAAATR